MDRHLREDLDRWLTTEPDDDGADWTPPEPERPHLVKNPIAITDIGEGCIALAAPYYEVANSDYRNLGGNWNRHDRRWEFDARDRDRLRGVLLTHFGHDDRPYQTVDARVKIEGNYNSCPELWMLGRLILRRSHRDARITLGTGVVLIEGTLPGRGGSVKYPALGEMDVIVEVHDVPAGHPDLLDEDVDIVDSGNGEGQ